MPFFSEAALADIFMCYLTVTRLLLGMSPFALLVQMKMSPTAIPRCAPRFNLVFLVNAVMRFVCVYSSALYCQAEI